MIPFFDGKRQTNGMRTEIDAAIKSVVDSGHFVLGEKGKAFEEAFSDFIDVPYAVAVNSGTDAIKISLRGLSIGQGDEVITVANTAVPTVSAIRETGAIPVFADTDEYFTLDPMKLDRLITEKTRAIVAVHLYGQMADMERITSIASKHGLYVLEDCAQSIGAKEEGKMAGSIGDAGCFSFYPTKNLGAMGDGGIITTGNKEFAEKCRALRKYGMTKQYYAESEGYNSRMDEIQAAILLAKLAFLEKWNRRRREIAEYYLRNIKNPRITIPMIRPGNEHVFHLFVIFTDDRPRFMEHMDSKEIGYGIHYEFPIHLQKAYRFLNYEKVSLPRTEEASKHIVSLPIFPELTDEEVGEIVSAVNSF